MRLGLVLGGGGVVGEAFHRGVLRAMHDVGLDPRAAQVIVGTSAGSVVAASLRRRAPAEPVPAVQPLPRPRFLGDRAGALELSRRPRQALNAVLMAPGFASGRTSTDFLAEGLRGRHGSTWPQASTWVVAVRRRDGRRTVFGREGEPVADLGSAVAASCAIPGYFEAVDIEGVGYVDGGVHSPTNADLVASLDLDLVVISSPMSITPRAVRPRADVGFRLLFHHYLLEEVWAVRRRGTTVVAVEPDTAVLQASGLNLMRGRHLDRVEETAHRLARSRLAALPGLLGLLDGADAPDVVDAPSAREALGPDEERTAAS